MTGQKLRRMAHAIVALAVVLLVGLSLTAQAEIVVDTAFTDITQIRTALNSPYFGADQTVNVAAINVTGWSYGTGGGTLYGMGFHDLNPLSAQTGAGVTVNNGAPGISMDYSFVYTEDASMRDLTSTSLSPGSGSDWQTAINAAVGNWYTGNGPAGGHKAISVTLHGLAAANDVYVQMLGGQHGWNGNVFVTANGTRIGAGTTDWASNKTNKTTGLLGFTGTTDASGNLAIGMSSNFFAGISAIIVSQKKPITELYFDTASGTTTWTNGGTGWSFTSGGPYDQNWGATGLYRGHFEGTAGTVTVSGAINRVDALSFDVDGYTLSGGSIALASTVITVPAGTATINSALTGAGLQKNGSGTLVLGGANTYTGPTTINGGALGFATGVLDTSTTIVFGGGALQWGAGNTQDVSGKIAFIAIGKAAQFDTNGNDITFATGLTGAGGLTKLGEGTLTLSVANAYTGPTTVGGGTLKLGTAGAMSAGGLTVNAGTLDLAGKSQTVASLSGAGGSIVSATAATLTVNQAAGSTTYSGVIGGPGAISLVKSGGGAVTLAGANTYTGPTTINGGTLGFATGSLDSTSGITFGGGALQWAAGNTQDGSGKFAAIAAGLAAILDTNGNDVTFATGISGDGGLTKIGNGTLTIADTNAYTGATTINAGKLAFATGALDKSSGIVFNGGALQWAPTQTQDVSAKFVPAAAGQTTQIDTNGNDVTFAAPVTGEGGLLKIGDGALTAGAANSYTGPTIARGGTLDLGSNSTVGSSAVDVVVADTAGSATLKIAGGAVQAKGIGVGGPGATGVLEISGASTTVTTNGGVAPWGGALRLGAWGGSDGNGTVVQSDGAVTFQNSYLMIGEALNSTGTYTITGGTLTHSGVGDMRTMIGWGSGTGNLNVGGTATVNLGGDLLMSYSGTSTVTVSDTATLTTVGVTVLAQNTGSRATLNLNGGVLATKGLSKGAGTAEVNFDGGTLRADASFNTALPMTINAAGAKFDTASNTLTFSGALSGDGGLTKNGDGTLALSATNSYAGPTHVVAGTVQLPGNVLIYRLDASDSSTLFQDAAGTTPVANSGEPVGLWKDKSVAGNHFAQSTDGMRPRYTANALNALPVLTFDGVDDRLTLPMPSTPQTVFLVNRPTASANLQGIWGHGDRDVSIRMGIPGVSTSWRGPGDQNNGDYTYNDGVLYINGVQTNTFGDLGTAHVLTAYRGSGISASTGSTQLGWNYPGRVYKGDIAEVLVFGNALSAANREAIESYLAGKWLGATPVPFPSFSTDGIPDTSAVTLDAGAVLDLNGNVETIGPLAGEGTVLLGEGLLTINSTDGAAPVNSTFSGAINGAGGVIKSGDGRLTLDGTNDYTGGTTVSGGTLQIAAPNALPAGRILTIGEGGAVVLASGLSAGAAGSAAQAVPEPGTLVLLAIGALAMLLGLVRARAAGRA